MKICRVLMPRQILMVDTTPEKYKKNNRMKVRPPFVATSCRKCEKINFRISYYQPLSNAADAL